MNFIGIDIGTSTISGIIYNLVNKKMEKLTIENNSSLKANTDWEKLQDPKRIIKIVREILEYFISNYSNIKGIGITGQMHGVLYTDDQGNSLGELISWQDGRGNLIYKDNLSYAEYLSQKTGYSLSSGFGLVSHFYNITNNKVPEKANKICTIMDYIIMDLTGNMNPFIDTTNAASLGFFDLNSMKFDLNAINDLNLNPDILPSIVDPFKMIGTFNSIPVFPAIGDNQAGFLGSVNCFTEATLINIGTSGQISLFSNDLLKNEILDTRPFPGGGYIMVGASLCGGNSLKILKEFFEKSVKLFCAKNVEIDNFYQIANSLEIKNFTKEKKLHVETLFDGTRLNPNLRGSINNISISNLTPQDLIIGFYYGISNELHNFYNSVPEIIRERKRILIGSGNAIRKNNLLCKVLEDVFKYKIKIPKNNEEAAFGACIIAIIGGRFINDISDTGELVEYIC